MALFERADAIETWLARWRERLAQEPQAPEARARRMRRANPAVIPRNHRVQEAISAAERDDFAPFETLREVLAEPFVEQPGREAYARPAEPAERVFRTFCGT